MDWKCFSRWRFPNINILRAYSCFDIKMDAYIYVKEVVNLENEKQSKNLSPQGEIVVTKSPEST